MTERKEPAFPERFDRILDVKGSAGVIERMEYLSVREHNHIVDALEAKVQRLREALDAADDFIEQIRKECSQITGNKYDGKKAEGCVFFIETGIGLYNNESRNRRQALQGPAPREGEKK